MKVMLKNLVVLSVLIFGLAFAQEAALTGIFYDGDPAKTGKEVARYNFTDSAVAKKLYDIEEAEYVGLFPRGCEDCEPIVFKLASGGDNKFTIRIKQDGVSDHDAPSLDALLEELQGGYDGKRTFIVFADCDDDGCVGVSHYGVFMQARPSVSFTDATHMIILDQGEFHTYEVAAGLGARHLADVLIREEGSVAEFSPLYLAFLRN